MPHRQSHRQSHRQPHRQSHRQPAEQLLSAAEELFAERGYRLTSVAQICARAGIATGSFYAHFSSKQEAFAAVIGRIGADLGSALRLAIEEAGNEPDAGRACLRAFLEMFRKRPRADRVIREAEFVAPDIFREHCELLVRSYARGVRQAQLAGHVDVHHDPEVIAYIYAGIGHFTGIRWAAGTGIPDDVLEDILSVLAPRLAPREEIAALEDVQQS